MRVRAGVGAVVLVAAGLSGCASHTERYCSTLKDDSAALKKLSAESGKPGGEVLQRSLAIFTELRSAAPPDVAPDWNDFVYAWKTVVDAFAAAGVDPARFDPSRRPPGVSTGQFQAIKQAAAELGSQKVRAAAARIEDHARTVCKVELGRSGLGGGGGL